MDLVKKLGHLLHFVDHDLANRVARRELFPEPFGVLQIAAELIRLEKVDPECVRISRPKQRGFACLPGPPEKKGLTPGCGEGELSFEHELHIIMII